MKEDFRIGEWLIRPRRNQIARGNEVVPIEPRVMAVLLHLASRADDVVTRDELLSSVWKDTAVGDEVLTNAIRELRKAFGDEAKSSRYIQTFPKQGYRLVAAVSPARPSRRRLVPAVAALALALAAVVGALFVGRSPPEVSEPSSTAVVVFPFEIRGSEDLEYLREGMVDLLGLKLDGGGELRTIDSRSLLGYLAENGIDSVAPEAACNVLRHFNGSFLLLGSVVQTPPSLTLHASLYDRDCRHVVTEESVAVSEDLLLSSIDDLAIGLLQNRLRARESLLSPTTAVSTRSLPALKSYLRGERLYRAGDWGASARELRAAVELDPDFALAWFHLALAEAWPWPSVASLVAVEKALSLGSRLKERDRLRARAFQAYLRGELDEAEERYQAFLGRYPDDVQGLLEAFVVREMFNNPRLGRASELPDPLVLRALSLDPENGEAQLYLRGAWLVNEDWERVARWVEEHQVRNVRYRALLAFVQGSEAEQKERIEELARTGDWSVIEVAFDLATYARQLDGAARVADLLTAPGRASDVRAIGHSILASVAIARTRWDDARAYLARSREAHRDLGLLYTGAAATRPFLEVPGDDLEEFRDALLAWDASSAASLASSFDFIRVEDGYFPLYRTYLLGRVAARLGDHASASTHADALASVPVPDEAGSLPEDLAHELRGWSAWLQDRPEEALEHLERARIEGRWLTSRMYFASPIQSLSNYRYLRGVVLEALGRGDEALGWWDSFGRAWGHEFTFRDPIEKRRAEILMR